MANSQKTTGHKPSIPTMATAPNGLGKSKRLKSRKLIEGLFAGGKSFFVHPIKVFWKIAPLQNAQPFAEQAFSPSDADAAPLVAAGGGQPVQIGVSASKRNFKKAVHRNRIKRLLREAYRLHQHTLCQLAATNNCSLQVFFIFVDKSLPTFTLIEDKMVSCVKRLEKIVGEVHHEKLL